MGNIDNNTFVHFILNDMNKEEMLKTESQLINDGEASAILACSTSLWETTSNALEIVGDVRSKIFGQKDRSEISQDSIQANKLKNTMTMVQLTLSDGKVINRIIKAFDASQSKSLTLDENLKNFYKNECPGALSKETETVIAGIKEGITSFDSALAQMIAADDFEVDKFTEKLLKGKTLEDKYNILLNFLVALHTLDSENVKTADGSYKETFDEIKNRFYSAGVPVTEEMVTELAEKIKDILEKGTCSLTSAEAVDELLKNLDKSDENVKIFVANQEELYKQKMVLSTAIMIGIRNNSIKALEGRKVPPQVIGAGVSAGLEQQNLIANLQAGNTPLDKALKILKYIGGAILLYIGINLGVSAIVGLSYLMGAWILGMVGFSTIATILTWVVTILFFSLPLAESFAKGLSYVLRKAGDFYDLAVSKVRRKTFPREASFIDWLKFKIDRGEVVEQGIKTDQAEIVFA